VNKAENAFSLLPNQAQPACPEKVCHDSLIFNYKQISSEMSTFFALLQIF